MRFEINPSRRLSSPSAPRARRETAPARVRRRPHLHFHLFRVHVAHVDRVALECDEFSVPVSTWDARSRPVTATRVVMRAAARAPSAGAARRVARRDSDARAATGARAGGRSVRGRTRCEGLAVEQNAALVDFYELLGVADDADVKTIKKAYYGFAKECHPDVSEDEEEGHDMCVLLNEAYEILSDPIARALYDAELEQQREDDEDSFTGNPYSKWTTRKAKPGETRAVFVDEFTCIGCKQCVWQAPATFRMNDDYGRSRVFAQWLNDEDDIQCAIDSCPVDCIHWVEREQLPFLEHVAVNYEKVSVGIMQSQTGVVTDPFEAASSFQKMRQRKIDARAEELAEQRRRMTDEEKRANTSEAQRRAYRKSADAIRARWTEATGVAFARARRRYDSNTGSTIPFERSVVLYGSPGSRDDLDDFLSFDEDDDEDDGVHARDAVDDDDGVHARDAVDERALTTAR
jgi:ferredoxin